MLALNHSLWIRFSNERAYLSKELLKHAALSSEKCLLDIRICQDLGCLANFVQSCCIRLYSRKKNERKKTLKPKHRVQSLDSSRHCPLNWAGKSNRFRDDFWGLLNLLNHGVNRLGSAFNLLSSNYRDWTVLVCGRHGQFPVTTRQSPRKRWSEIRRRKRVKEEWMRASEWPLVIDQALLRCPFSPKTEPVHNGLRLFTHRPHAAHRLICMKERSAFEV